MLESTLIARRSAARIFMGPLAALCVLVPRANALTWDEQEKVSAEGAARKLEKARKAKAREEKESKETLRHFQQKLNEYVQVHNRAAGRIGAVQSETSQQALAAAISARRHAARQGDIFLLEIQPLFRRLLAEQLKGPDSLPAQKAVVEGNPGHDEDSPPVAVRVNAPYPRGAARSTVPPSVLVTLPRLPDCLNYLFVGRNLILVDAIAQLIVDFIPGAAPELIK
jgi:hypothetical protein